VRIVKQLHPLALCSTHHNPHSKPVNYVLLVNNDQGVVGAAYTPRRNPNTGPHSAAMYFPASQALKSGLALARAFYGDPPILVLDEPNAFLDAEGEAALVEAMRSARARGATVLLVAHRRSILEIVDQLLVLEGGRPTMFGPAKDVVARLSAPPPKEKAS